ncbi:PspC domain-containing protein [Streptomyces albus]
MSEEEQRAAGHAGAAGEGTGQGAGPTADGSGGTGGKPGAPGTSGVSGASGAREGAGRGGAQGAEPSWGAHNPPPGAAKGQPLRRSRTHKIAGGVCGGMGRYFDLDPVIFRVPLVVLSVVGGLGLVSYGFAWLLIPAEGRARTRGGGCCPDGSRAAPSRPSCSPWSAAGCSWPRWATAACPTPCC